MKYTKNLHDTLNKLEDCLMERDLARIRENKLKLKLKSLMRENVKLQNKLKTIEKIINN